MNLHLWQHPAWHAFLSTLLLVCAVTMPAAHAAVAPSLHPFTITRTTGVLIGPVISGNLVAWVAARTQRHARLRHVSLGDVFAKDLRTRKLERVTTRPTAVASPVAPEGVAGYIAVGNQVVVWADCRNCRDVAGLGGVAGADLYAKNLRFGREIRLSGGYAATVSGKSVYWVDCCGTQSHLYATDTISGRTRLLSARGRPSRLSSDGRTLVYASNGGIYGRRLQSGREFAVARRRGREGLSDPKVSGAFAIWTRGGASDGSVVIEGKNLRTGRRYTIAHLPPERFIGWTGPQTAIGGTVVLWDQALRDLGPHGAALEIRGRDLRRGGQFRIGAAGRSATNPSVSGKILVWQTARIDKRTGRLRSDEVRGAVLR